MAQRLFEVLNQMNLNDIKNGTATVGVCGVFVESRLTKRGTEITMGAPIKTSTELLSGEIIPVLLLINREEYEKAEQLILNT